ncbi:MAG TPA: HAMP domain-containing sensor histidine kinase [Miltoncostaea sp.]|nr:HAMP domain-containing sensor histidine kinase [Miltoncostaea sp.]
MRLRPASLRARLLIITLAMVAVGLALAGWAVNRSLHSFLVDRVDRDLIESTGPALGQLTEPDFFGGGARVPRGLPNDAAAQLRDAAGQKVKGTEVRDSGATLQLPADIPDGYSTADLPGDPGEYRILSIPLAGVPHGPGPTSPSLASATTLVVAVPLADVNSTLHRLTLIELAVGAAVLGALALLAWWLVRLGLRPLERIEATAERIAAGDDLDRRIPDADPRTEVGRLARALNAMLDRLQGAFAERRASEDRLRRFVADASHELQTPLTSVRGYAELFRRGAARNPEDLDVAMTRIEAEATRMGVLVDDLLTLARLDQGRELRRDPVDLVPLARDLVSDARVVAPDRPIELESDGPVVVEGDDPALRQVVGNLIANARVHTPPGNPVTVRVRADDGHGVVEVADRGPGLAPDHAARVFERFFRADPSRARASGGSGLGLSIVAAVAEAHGGVAEVDSAPGVGATFRIVLPLAGADDPAGTPHS